MSNATFVYKNVVESWADIDREIEKEAANLEWLEYKNKAEAKKEATDYIYKKYKEVILRLQDGRKR